MEIEFPPVFNIVLVSLFFVISFLWEYSVTKKDYEADFKFRSIKKTIGLSGIIFALAWTLLLIYSNGYFTYYILIFWCIPVAELGVYFIYKTKKPYTLFINGNILTLNKLWTQKRNLTELNQIQFDRFSKNLKLDFNSKSGISIRTTEYETNDIKELLEIMINNSEYKVSIPQNY